MLVNKYIKFFIIFILLYLKNSFALSIENKIILKIDNKIITSLDIKKEKAYLSILNPKIKNLSSDQKYQFSKNSLIREKIKKKEIINSFGKIEVEQDVLDQVIKNMYTDMKLESKENFKKYLKKNKLNYQNVEEKIKIEILWNRLVYFKYKSKINIDEEEIRNQIKNNKKNFKEYLLQEILFELRNNEKLETKYSSISKDIKNLGFEKSALIHSISDTSKKDGIIGWVNENSLNKKILDEIEKINIGKHTKPIIIPGGFLILKIKEKKITEKKIDINKELEKVIRSKTNQQLNQFSLIFYNKIKKNTVINEI